MRLVVFKNSSDEEIGINPEKVSRITPVDKDRTRVWLDDGSRWGVVVQESFTVVRQKLTGTWYSGDYDED